MGFCLDLMMIIALIGKVDSDFIGYNITSTSATSDGHTAVILDGLPLTLEVVTGFYVTMATSDCPIKLQIWRRVAFLKYTILCERDFAAPSPGLHLISLNDTEEFIIGNGDRLGFSSLSSDSSCVAYEDIGSSGNESETLHYSFASGSPPTAGATYVFDSYKTTYLFGLGLRLKYGLSKADDFILAGERKVFGYNVTDSTKLAGLGRASILLEGLRLTEGRVTGYYVRLPNANCPIKLQIWRPTTGLRYKLLGETEFTSTNAGYFHVPSSSALSVSVSDKLGFTSLDPHSSCIPYLFVSDNRRSQTLFYSFGDDAAPDVDAIYDFNSLQSTFLFTVEVAIEEVMLVLPGPTGSDGAMGAQGPLGVKGVVGEAGESGDKGSDGERGTQGDDGTKGEGGTVGPVGSTGLTGDRGEQGAEGITGIDGQIGPNGTTGDKGPQGEEGYIGEKGPAGVRGDRGLPGQTGVTGEVVKGDDGEVGPIGLLGHTGSAGMAGETGPRGDVGLQGMTGPAGLIGSAGPMWTPKDLCKTMNICSHGCDSDGMVAVCTCREGYRLVDTYRCLDVNECELKNGLCEYDCVNTVGSHRCSCPPGLLLSKDNRRCNDVDECKATSSPCADDQLCINTWGGFHCAGPWPEEAASLTQTVLDSVFPTPLVTRHVVIGLVLWMVLLSLFLLTAIILLIPEMCRSNHGSFREPVLGRFQRAEFYYPAFFPRVTLDRRASADKLDMVGTVATRRMSKDEANAMQEEMYVNRGANLNDTERKISSNL